VTLEPTFVNSSIVVEKVSGEVSLDVTVSSELEVDEAVPCELHFSFPLEEARLDAATGDIYYNVENEEVVIAHASGRNYRRVRESDNLTVHHSVSDANIMEISLAVN